MLIEQPALITFLKQVNELRRAQGEHDSTTTRSALENVAATLFGCSNKLAVYGSLRPGEENHSVMEHLDGTWCTGFVRGKLFESGWGAAIGYPAIRWDPAGELIEVHLFESDDLELGWTRLDDFEGHEYVRILVPVENSDSVLAVANIYELRAR
jgi:gamma-glutamylcyclotransferase (GGCT)/AIG2-like uncharacterized protein YtfP